jgi:SNF2 family DNA or RNA helicase
LRILDYSGAERRDSFRQIAGYDLVLCTYGTMRRDIVELQKLEFDYIILDEAQAIKNRDSDSAKAARLLKGRQKLALSGTPVENHLGELWSLFEFLNPGMLGSSSAFRAGKRSLRNPDGETRKLLGRAVRPFLLRRTKSQVARELPPKIEQTLYCELPADQRRLYNELRDHYRRQLLGRVEQDGIGKSKIQILKALLRLRQAACHPALLQRGRSDDMSAKLESLLPQLAEISSEGHKTLIFSQFTSFLDIVRKHLDRQQLTYSYLDGQTVDRQAVVERFQNDPECPLFLVSLKAGGVGLNLTAAEYVFLLDPWWNPAVEAQAIDRTHRIGQSNTVFAYRMIARDTVEEKVLELQNRKRDLAASIICEDNRLVGNLQREDLELLLS